MKTKVDKLSAATTVFVVAVILAMTILSCKQLFADPVQYLIMANADTQELYFCHQELAICARLMYNYLQCILHPFGE